MIGRSWAEWEESIEDSDLDNQAESDYADYRATVRRETPDLLLENDIKSEVSSPKTSLFGPFLESFSSPVFEILIVDKRNAVHSFQKSDILLISYINVNLVRWGL